MRASLAMALFAFSACGPTVGDPCTTGTDCGPGAVCINRDYAPGGYCSTACKTTAGPGQCPTGSVCVDDALGKNSPACFRMCNVLGDCRNGYTCRTVNGSMPICVGQVGF